MISDYFLQIKIIFRKYAYLIFAFRNRDHNSKKEKVEYRS
jgi:hypothetical protein